MKLSHVSWNLAGLTLPLGMAALAVPNLLQLLGQERFGMLTLAWGLIGYAGALDLGIGRATTYLVSTLRGGNPEGEQRIPSVLNTAERLTTLAGGVGMLLLALAVWMGAGRLLEVKSIDSSEITIAALMMALALPLQALSATYRGVNEAYLNFRSISLLRVALGVANFGLPWVAACFSNKIYWLVSTILFSRALALFIYRILAKKCLNKIKNPEFGFKKDIAKQLARFGGWFTVSSVLSPLISIADRFIIASAVSAAALSVYIIPYEMVVQSLALVGAITTVAFPYLSKLRVSDPERALKVFKKALALVIAMMMGVALFYFFFGGLILKVWLGHNYTQEHARIVSLLCFGLISYTAGTMCVSWLHSNGRTQSTAKLNVVEFPVYLILIYWCVNQWGIQGAAMAWVARVSLNAGALLFLVSRMKMVNQKAETEKR